MNSTSSSISQLFAPTILDVPYLVQPTATSCQATCLKMYALYLSRFMAVSSDAAGMEITAIKDEINASKDRPDKGGDNSWTNMAWWLTKNFQPPEFGVSTTKSALEAIYLLTRSIDDGYPVIISTNHENVEGHIIVVIGYEGIPSRQSVPDMVEKVRFVCHDPYGKFNPQLGSKLYGKRRFEGGMSLLGGGEVGPGKGVRLTHEGVKRMRQDKHSSGTYAMITAKI